MRRPFLIVAFTCFAIASAAGTGKAEDWLTSAFSPTPNVGPEVATTDLLGLRDLGGISVSPRGDMLVFSLRQGDPAQNKHVVRWFLKSMEAASDPVMLDIDGGRPITSYGYGFPDAYIPLEAAKWSPDGKKIAFRRREEHRIELWVVDVISRKGSRISPGVAQVVSFAWSRDGTLLFKTGLNYEVYQRELDAEAKHGWLQDKRVTIFASHQRPAEPDCVVLLDDACDNNVYATTADGSARVATDGERTQFGLFNNPRQGLIPAPDRRIFQAIAAPSGEGRVWTENADPKWVSAILPVLHLRADVASKPCSHEACEGALFRGFGWARNGKSIWFVRGESDVGRKDGAPFDVSAVYEWRLGSGAVSRVWRGEDLFDDCHGNGTTVYCARESATHPRHIVAIGLDTRAIRTVVDPNPQWATKKFPKIEKMRISGLENTPGFAHVVYPYRYDRRRTYPLVVVQYISKGFLRGGLGNEVPIFPLAKEGYVVLSIDRPMYWDELRTLPKDKFDQFLYQGNLRDRRSVTMAIESAVEELVSRSIADGKRVAITGLSSGAEIVHYALQHSPDRYAAAIASSGAHDITFLPLMPESPERDRRKLMFNTPTLVPKPDNALYALAWSRMPDRLRTPLLINAGEHEAMLGFEGLESLKDAHRPLEVRVFPDEFHIKYHPQSYAGIYDNNVMWLNFWLQDIEDLRPEFQKQYKRWRVLRAQLCNAVPTYRSCAAIKLEVPRIHSNQAAESD